MNDNMKFAALLPMKGHSERVKNKNLRMFDGLPLMCSVIKTLDECSKVAEIFIDTDSNEIADNALKYSSKVKIIERPTELCGDFVSMNDIIKYDLSVTEYEYYIQTHATNPLLTADTLSKVCEFYANNIDKYDSVFTVNKLQTRLYDSNGKAVNHDPDKLIRTQDLEPLYEENSNIYIFSQSSFNSSNARIGKKAGIYEMNFLEAIDIDTENDFILAEQIYKMRKKGELHI